MAADGHLGMTALSRVTLASAGLSCENRYSTTAMTLILIVTSDRAHVFQAQS